MNLIDPDYAYFLGMVVARGTIIENQRQITVNFPHSSLQAQGIHVQEDQNTSIRLGLTSIRERLADLLGADVRIIEKGNDIDLSIRFLTNAMPWRALLSIVGEQRSFRAFQVPAEISGEDIHPDVKREFVRGFGDVAGNVRYANRYVDGRIRVRLDILNHPHNWRVAVDLCLLLQEGLDVPVQNITWGHPNMNRDFREHQLNVFVIPYLQIGFAFQHKKAVLEELAAEDRKVNDDYLGCPGRRKLKGTKEPDKYEHSSKLPVELRGKHFDSYWQLCKALGCPREPHATQLSLFEALESEE